MSHFQEIDFLLNDARLDIKNKKNEFSLDYLKAKEFLLNFIDLETGNNPLHLGVINRKIESF